MHRATSKNHPASVSVTSTTSAIAAATAFSLADRCVLCVGGLTGARNHYRVAIEERHGKFIHHDGGREDSLHRLQPMLTGADMVLCASGNISHNAYQLVKQLCKKQGKPCVMVKGTGIASFIDGLGSLSGKLLSSQRGETVLKSGRHA
ncbi:hypothetical protein F506_06060 [Herbaspirillum hiltneri N3]|uniref:DUF2325 domain-containing protein n=1 Tax=Herbaspirillum hiltneri N3 TaxID=1262470 RepID=A0ABN4I4R8_9BURK|nr:DUF2325 domain-containing protein [Herbaspirillum hiltneri]AKZ65189.1 hypothetical protein F506_06060 [Herbaspirillum hiltneri N3]